MTTIVQSRIQVAGCCNAFGYHPLVSRPETQTHRVYNNWAATANLNNFDGIFCPSSCSSISKRAFHLVDIFCLSSNQPVEESSCYTAVSCTRLVFECLNLGVICSCIDLCVDCMPNQDPFRGMLRPTPYHMERG